MFGGGGEEGEGVGGAFGFVVRVGGGGVVVVVVFFFWVVDIRGLGSGLIAVVLSCLASESSRHVSGCFCSSDASV